MNARMVAYSLATVLLLAPFSARADVTAGGALGAVAGGLLGSQVGQGNGRVAASALGAVIGYNVGQSVSPPERVVEPRQPVYVMPYRDDDEDRDRRREDDD